MAVTVQRSSRSNSSSSCSQNLVVVVVVVVGVVVVEEEEEVEEGEGEVVVSILQRLRTRFFSSLGLAKWQVQRLRNCFLEIRRARRTGYLENWDLGRGMRRG